MALQIYNECCKNCLLSKDSIVSPARRKDILQDCTRKQTHFICHRASIDNKEIVCKNFYDKMGHISQMIRIAERLNMIEMVPQPDGEKLTSYKEQNIKK